MFGKIGKFLKKKIIAPVDKAVIKPVDRAIIKPIDKAIVQPIDKAIIQPIDKAIVQPIDKAIIKPIDKAIIQPINKAIVEPIREKTDKDFALRRERKHVEKLQAGNSELRPQFFQSQQDLAVAQSEYERISEDFVTAYGVNNYDALIRRGSRISAPLDPKAGLPDIVVAVQDSNRFILNVVSLGLSEAMFNIDEIPKEREHLRRKISHLSQESQQLKNAIGQIRNAEKQFKTATEEIIAEHAKLGADVTASDVHVLSARKSAQKEIVQRLLSEKVSRTDIAMITGFSPDLIAEIA